MVRRWLSEQLLCIILCLIFDVRNTNCVANVFLHFIIELQIPDQHFIQILIQLDHHTVCSSIDIYGYRKPVYDGVSMNNITLP